MNKYCEQIQKLGELPNKIGEDAWPNGGVLECKRCGYQIGFTSKQAGHYLAYGWPNHCNETMMIGE